MRSIKQAQPSIGRKLAVTFGLEVAAVFFGGLASIFGQLPPSANHFLLIDAAILLCSGLGAVYSGWVPVLPIRKTVIASSLR